MYTHIPSPLILPPTPPSSPSRSSQSTKLSSLCFIADSHQLSVLHMVVYICQYFFLSLSHLPSLLPCFKFLTDFLWLFNICLGIIVVIDICVHFVRLGSARYSSPLTTKSRKAWPYNISVYNRVGSQKRRHCFYLIKISAPMLGRCLYWFRV